MTWFCRVCDSESSKCYRCEHCGADLVGREDEGQEDIAADGGTSLEAVSTHGLVIRALADLGDQEADNGIPTRDVVDWVVARAEVKRADVMDAIEWQHKHGEIYEPREDYLRRTEPDDSRWS